MGSTRESALVLKAEFPSAFKYTEALGVSCFFHLGVCYYYSFMGRAVCIYLHQIIFRTVIAFSANRIDAITLFFKIFFLCSSSSMCLFCSAFHPMGNCEGNAVLCYRKLISWRLFIRHNLLTLFLSWGKNRNETFLWLTTKNLNESKGEERKMPGKHRPDSELAEKILILSMNFQIWSQ